MTDAHQLGVNFDVRASPATTLPSSSRNLHANTLHYPTELSLWMSHEVDIDRGADTNILDLALTIVCDDPTIASVDQGEHWGARSGVEAPTRDVHVGHRQ